MDFANNWEIYLISFTAFVAALMGLQGIYLLWQELDIEKTVRVNRRMRKILSPTGFTQTHAVSAVRERQLSEVESINRFMLDLPHLHALDNKLDQAGLDITVARYILIQVILSILILGLLLILTKGILFLIIPLAFSIGFLLPRIYVANKRQQRMADFTEQLPNALDYIARSLRAGNPFSASLRSAAEELPEPTASEFHTTFEQINFGLDLELALDNLVARTGSEELRYFITSVLIQRTTGGNLAEVLNRIAHVMRSRTNTFREIQVLAAEMKYSANVLIALPIFVALVLALMNPGYLAVLFSSSLGLLVIGAQLLLMLIGYFIIQKMINFRV